MTELLISGALAMAYLVASMFFLKFWSATHDRLFGLFAACFALLAFQRVALPYAPEAWLSLLYGVRVVAFLLIIIAIVDKNRAGR